MANAQPTNNQNCKSIAKKMMDNDIKIQKYCNTFENSSGNGPLINSTKSGTLTVYTGKEKCIPKKLQKFFNFLKSNKSMIYFIFL